MIWETLLDYSPNLLRGSFLLAVASCLAIGGTKWLGDVGGPTASLVWSMVLITGMIVVPAHLQVAWYAPPEPTSSEWASPATTLPQAQSSAADSRAHVDSGVAHATVAPHHAESPSKTASIGIASLCVAFWLIGSALLLVVSTASYAGLLISLRRCWRPQKDWLDEYERVAHQFGITSPPRLVVHPTLGPFLCMTPLGNRLVIPADQWSLLSQHQREAVIRHELAHHRRRDLLRSLPAQLVVLVHWFNPFAWYAARRLEENAEIAADAQAIGQSGQHAGDLAAALLTLSQGTSRSLLIASAARPRGLKRRLQQLAGHSTHQTNGSLAKRAAVIVAMLSLLMVSSVQIQLVAQEAQNGSGDSQPPAVSIETAKDLAGQLAIDDELTQSLHDALQTRPGTIVLRDRVGAYENAARLLARYEAVPKFFEENFTRTDNGLALREDRKDLYLRLATEAKKLNDDIDKLKKSMRDKAAALKVESDLDKLVHRFLVDDATPVILYSRQIRTQLAGMQSLERVYADVIAKRADGKYALRPDAREQTEARIQQFEKRRKLIERLQQDLVDFADDIAPTDPMHQDLKRLLAHPIVTTQLALPLIDSDQPPRQLSERIIGQFDNAFVEGAEGLQMRDEVAENIKRMVVSMQRVVDVTEGLREPLRQFVSQMTEETELDRKLKKAMGMEITLVRAASRVQYAGSDVSVAVDRYFSSFLSEDDNGTLTINTANVTEQQITGLVSGIFREARIARRRGREVTELTELITDQVLKEVMMSPGGKIAIGDALRDALAQTATNGLDQWIADHLAEVENGRYSILEERRPAIVEFVRQVDDLKRESENADF